MAKITKRIVDAARPKVGRYVLWDDGNDAIKGFGLLVLPSGVKSYVFNYRNTFGRERRITIGKHSGGLTPDMARTLAEGYRRRVLDGGDPLTEKTAMRQALTIGGLFDQYLASDAFEKKALSTQAIDKGRIAHHLRPLLGNTALPALTMADVEKAQRSIRDGKTAIERPSENKRGRIRVTGGEGTARMAIRLFRAILSWGTKQKIVPKEIADAAAHVDLGRDGQRNLIVQDQKAYVRLFETLDRMTDPSALKKDEKLVRAEVADAIRVIALTGARRGEITGLRWAYVDAAAGTLVLPIEAHKSGRKTGQARVIGLPVVASEIISRQHPGKPDELVFRAARGGARIDLTKSWRQICKAADLPVGLGLHGLRHSLASSMAMSGAGAAEIMAALGHRDLSTSQGYIHFAQDRRQALAEKAAKGISAAFMSRELAAVVNEGDPLQQTETKGSPKPDIDHA